MVSPKLDGTSGREHDSVPSMLFALKREPLPPWGLATFTGATAVVRIPDANATRSFWAEKIVFGQTLVLGKAQISL